MIEQIEKLEREVEKVEALLRPKVCIATLADELLRKADECCACTGRYESPTIGVQVYTPDKTIAEIEVCAKTISRTAWQEINKQREEVKEYKNKLDKIKAILNE